MPASQKIKHIKRLGIIAGGGMLPSRLIDTCNNLNISPYVIAFHGQTDPNLIDDGIAHEWTNLGSAGKIIKFFKSNSVSDLVMIGSIKRPSLSSLKPDIKGLQILSKIGIKSLGDNQLLEILAEELNHQGFTLYGIHDFCNELLAPEGVIGSIAPSEEDLGNISIGLNASQALGALDIGQAVIVQQGIIVAVEGVEGTDALISRSKDLLKDGSKGILVKSRKPQQSKNLDLPAMGVETIEKAYRSGLSGIAIQTDNVLITNTKDVAELADKYKLFIYGVRL